MQVSGTLAKVGSSSFTVTESDGTTITVDTTTHTHFTQTTTASTVTNTTLAAFSNLAVGDNVTVSGIKTATDGTITAVAVNVGVAPAVNGGPRAGGPRAGGPGEAGGPRAGGPERGQGPHGR